MVRPSLDVYRRKRDFRKTPEPPGKMGKGLGGRFVVHEHHASRLHFDLRLEMGGVLKSFAVPKGPSLDPKDRRLAVETEDHPVKYLAFQGSIGDGQYGAGQMVIWDAGTYSVPPGEDPLDQYAQGKLHLEFAGGKLRGGFMLIRSSRGDRQWLLFKKRDDEAREDGQAALLLPYGARTEKPPGFEIPDEALRNVPAAPGVTPKGRGKAAKAFRGPPGSHPASLPPFIEPMLATLADKPFDDPAWIFETKWDGWRALLRKDGGGIHLISRTGKSLDAMFPELLETAGSIAAEACLLDGEITVLDDQGIPRFQLLQNRLKGKGRMDRLRGGQSAGAPEPGRIVYYAFDMPFRDGFDLTGSRLIDRKEALRAVVAPASSRDASPQGAAAIRFSEHFEGRGQEVFREATRLGFEGVMAKLKNGPYRRGRSADWLKIKSKRRQEVVIAGYTRPRGSRALFGSLVTGLYDRGELVFTGHVGGGFNAALLKQVHGFMKPLETNASPFAQVPKTNEKVQWVKPKLVAEAEFAEWTGDGRMRQPVFLGIRPDKDPHACVREVPQAAEKLKEDAVAEAVETEKKAKTYRARKPIKTHADKGRKGASASEAGPPGSPTEPVLTHPGKVLWPADGFTKGDLAAYYRAVAPILLPHLKDRPLILKRYPNGIEAPLFYQHDVKSAPAFVKIQPVKEKDGIVHYALCQNLETLLWLANLGVIAQNPWLSRVPHLDRPDWIVFDLDPQEVPFPDVCGLALYLKEILDGLGLKTYAKTSGSRGIHIYLPLKPAYDFSQALDFAQLVAALAVKKKPDGFTVDRSLKTRKRDRIYLDCMQNSVGKSVASVYSVRERPGATVSAALEWGELKKKIKMEDFTLRTLPKRLEKKGDLFAEVLRTKNPLEGALKKLEKLL